MSGLCSVLDSLRQSLESESESENDDLDLDGNSSSNSHAHSWQGSLQQLPTTPSTSESEAGNMSSESHLCRQCGRARRRERSRASGCSSLPPGRRMRPRIKKRAHFATDTDNSSDPERLSDSHESSLLFKPIAPSPNFMSTPLVSLSPREIKSVSFPPDSRLTSTAATPPGMPKAHRSEPSTPTTPATPGLQSRHPPPRALDIARGRKPFKADHELFKRPPSGLPSPSPQGHRLNGRPSSSSTTSPSSPAPPEICGSPALPPRHPLKPNHSSHTRQGHPHHHHPQQRQQHAHHRRRNSVSSGELSDLARDSGYGSSVTIAGRECNGGDCASDNDAHYTCREFPKKSPARPRSASATRAMVCRDSGHSLQQEQPKQQQHIYRQQKQPQQSLVSSLSPFPASVTSLHTVSSSSSLSPSSTLHLPPPPPSLLITPPESPTTELPLPPPPPPPPTCSDPNPSTISYPAPPMKSLSSNYTPSVDSPAHNDNDMTQHASHQQARASQNHSKPWNVRERGDSNFSQQYNNSMNPGPGFQTPVKGDRSMKTFSSKTYVSPPPRYEDAVKRVSIFRGVVRKASAHDKTAQSTPDTPNPGAEGGKNILAGDSCSHINVTGGTSETVNGNVSGPDQPQTVDTTKPSSPTPMQNGYVGLSIRQFEARAVSSNGSSNSTSDRLTSPPAKPRPATVTSSRGHTSGVESPASKRPPRPVTFSKPQNGAGSKTTFEDHRLQKLNGSDVTPSAHNMADHHVMPGFSREDSQVSDEVFLTDDNSRDRDDVADESSGSFGQADDIIDSKPGQPKSPLAAVSAGSSRRETGRTNLQTHERNSKRIILEVLV